MRNSLYTLVVLGTLSAACAEQEVVPTGSLELRPSVTLSVPTDASDLEGTAPARSSAGFYAAQTLAGRGGGIAVFDSTGTLIRELNAQGRGPGEFTDVQSVGFGPGDTLWVVEITRAHAFTPAPDLQFVRMVNFESATSSTVTPRGFLSRGLFTGEGIQAPSLRDWDGRVVARFTLPSEIAKMEAQMGPVALAADGALWFGHGERYEVGRFAAEGGDPRWIKRELAWFPPDEGYKGALNVVRPPARLQTLAADADGRVLVLSRRAHPNWAPMGGGTGGPERVERQRSGSAAAEAAAARPSLADWGKLFEFVLEVFSADGRLLASHVLDDGMQGFMDGSNVYQVLADESGHISIRLWSVRVSEGGSTP